MSFWGELKRRNVVKVGVAYAIVAWLLIQGADIIFPHLNLPSWAVTFLIVFLIIGFPIALIFAWAFEITPDGIKLTKEVPRAESITRLTGKKLNYILAGLLVLSIALLLFDNYYLDRRAIEPEQAPVVSDVEEAPKTIAVLPFVNLSSDPEQEYFVDGLSEEILNSLTQIPDLLVTGRTSSFTFKGSNKKTPEIANELGVENILEGSVRKAGNDLRITAQLLRGADGFHLWSKTYDRELKDIFVVQEDIATAVASELKVTLGIGKSLKLLGGTDNPEAYELYLIAKAQMLSTDLAEFSRALESINAALEIDPEFALAWVAKANSHRAFTTFGPANRVDSERDIALSAAQKAIELEPTLASAYAALGIIISSKGDFMDAGLAFRKAIELQTSALSGSDDWIGSFYSEVGYIKKSYELFEETRQKDPLDPSVRAKYMFFSGLLGDIQRAEKEYERGRALFGDQWDLGNQLITLLRLSFVDGVSRDDVVYSNLIFDVTKKYLDSPGEGLAQLYRIYRDDDNLSPANLIFMSCWAAYFGDTKFAMDAMEKGVRIEASGLWQIWLPVMKEVRQLPRFKALVKKIGLVDYWNKFGWPDICRQLDNGDFECD